MSVVNFDAVFGTDPDVTNFTPGRVNLIGEHTDYNGGMVLPTALELGISLSVSPRSDDRVRVWSDKFEDIAERRLDQVANDHWSDYILGAVSLASEIGFWVGGANIAAQTTLPFGAGISSSAAVTVGVLKAAREISGHSMSDKDIAVLARRVENEFIGMPCGIMDQMAVSIARPGQALALQTDTLHYDVVDLPQDYHMAVLHSGVFRQLNEGRYKERKEECDTIKAKLGHDNICQITEVEAKTLSELTDDLQRRARHCRTEHSRTVEATQCLRRGQMGRFGELMYESHMSMKEDFEITVPPIDDLVDTAMECGALGARMTGGGFGGCIVACVPVGELPAWRDAVLNRHPKAFWVA